jgi:iron-sulfur cluster assembly protein
MGMALDEPKEDDKVFEFGGITYLVETSVIDQVSPLTVDFLDDGTRCGFSITTKLSKPGSCGPCSC